VTKEFDLHSDVQPGAAFPDYELPDDERVPRKLSELQGDDRHRKIDPPILTAEVEDRLTNAE
jgi:hypothetical protein